MTDTPNKPLKDSDMARQNRLRQALRENLKRRKSQSRGRASVAGDPATAETSGTADAQDISSRPADPDQD
jgi:hypothetical protein